MNNLTGITITPGVLPPPLRESLEAAVERIGAKIIDSVRIDTTHFVCTEGRGRDWERANEMNIPVVRPEWIEGCEREGRIIGVRGYYLDADPKQRQVGSNPSLSGRPGNGTAATPSEQANIPQRPKEPTETPKSPDRESAVSGEPGPEVPPTPPRKDAPPPHAEEADEEEESEEEAHAEEEAEIPTTDAKQKERAESSEEDEEDEEHEEHEDESTTEEAADAPEEHSHRPERENSKEGADMEDVAL